MTFQELASSIDADIGRARDIEAFFEIADIPFKQVIEDKIHVQALNELLCRVRDEHLPITARHTSGSFIVLHSTPLSSWALVFHDQPARFLYLSPVHVLQANVGATEALLVDRYQCLTPEDFSCLDPIVKLSQGRPENCATGKVLKRNGRTDILDWRKGHNTLRPGVTLRINSLALEPFEWAFDRESRQAVGLSPVQGAESNLATLLTLLAVCGNSQTVELMEPLLQHERHFVRWSAARAIASLDADAGRAAALRLANDPHPEVRTAALSVLDGDSVSREIAA